MTKSDQVLLYLIVILC